MKFLAVFLFACISAVASCGAASAENIHMLQMEHTAAMQAACGPAHGHIDNDAFTTNQYIAKPADGKALVYFFFDPYSMGGGILGPHVHIGVAGKWVGAMAPPSFVALNLAPGTYPVCAKFSAPLLSPYVELDTLHVEAGKTYAYTTTLLTDMHSNNAFLMRPTDPDELKMYLHAQAALAAAKAALPPNHILARRAVAQFVNPKQNPAVLAACGPLNTQIKVALDPTLSLPKPPSQNALVNFVFDTHIWGGLIKTRGPVIKVGVDGKWVGALQNQSYFPLRIPPGEHHVCFAEKSLLYGNFIALQQVEARKGTTQYLAAYMLDAESPNGDAGGMYMTAYPVNRDEGKMLVQASARSRETALITPPPTPQ